MFLFTVNLEKKLKINIVVFLFQIVPDVNNGNNVVLELNQSLWKKFECFLLNLRVFIIFG